MLAVGAVARADVPDYLAAADVEAHDLQGYGLGTASLESMAAGVPVVAAVRPDNFPGVRLVSGRDLVLVPVGDARALAAAVADLLDDPGRRARIGASGQRLVRERFSLDTVLGQHLEVAGPDGHPHDRPVTVRPASAASSPRRPGRLPDGVDHPVAGQDAGALDVGVGPSPRASATKRSSWAASGSRLVTSCGISTIVCCLYVVPCSGFSSTTCW